jgi:hypothetical protein
MVRIEELRSVMSLPQILDVASALHSHTWETAEAVGKTQLASCKSAVLTACRKNFSMHERSILCATLAVMVITPTTCKLQSFLVVEPGSILPP